MFKTIIAATALIAAGAIFFLYTQPTYDAAGTTKAQIAQYDSALSKATELQQTKQTLLAKYNAFDPNAIDKLQKLLPDHVDNVRLILDLDNLAGTHGLALQNIVVSTPSQTSDQNDASAVGASNAAYDSLTLSFTTIATYDQFMQFLTDLETSLRIVDLASLKIAPSGASAGKGAQPTYAFDLTLRTYWLK